MPASSPIFFQPLDTSLVPSPRHCLPHFWGKKPPPIMNPPSCLLQPEACSVLSPCIGVLGCCQFRFPQARPFFKVAVLGDLQGRSVHAASWPVLWGQDHPGCPVFLYLGGGHPSRGGPISA